MNLIAVFSAILALRIASVFIVQTFYVPDEYWQSLEVAHKLAFGYGYLTWEWVHGIRSYIYPLIIAGVYKILALCSLDTAQLLVILPRLLQATFTAYSDYRFFVWTGKRKWALFLILVPWFWFYTGSRTLANTLEASLTTIALSYFPWYGEGCAYLWPAAICCFLRPTAAIIWLPLCIYHLRKSDISPFKLILKRFAPIGLLVATVGIAVDSYFHGKFIVTPYEFLKFNVFYNVGSFYGSHQWYWYFVVGLPTVLGVNTVPFILGTVETIRERHKLHIRKQLLMVILWSLIALSTIEHKEFRFVVSLLPFCLYICADYLTRWSYNAHIHNLWWVAVLIIAGNFAPAYYVSLIHQKGPMDVMPKLQDIARNYRDEHDHRANILFLMPCHSTPYYSHIHENVTMRFLTCEPNFKLLPDYKDEADKFFESPNRWLRSHLPSYPLTALPTHVVLYSYLANDIDDFLLKYKLLTSIDNNNFGNKYAHDIVESISPILSDEGKIYLETLLRHMQSPSSKQIQIYQRLQTGEENSFNRNEDYLEANEAINIRNSQGSEARNAFNDEGQN